MPVIIAHGALGPFDELIFGGVAVIFIVIMAVSWVKSRNTLPDLDADKRPAGAQAAPPDTPDRFRLD